MTGHGLTEAERAAADYVLRWAKAHELLRRVPGRRLFRVITPDDEEQYYTLVSDPEPQLIFHEPARFTVTVHAAKGACRAGHEVGDQWEFDWCTPDGLCGSAYHAMYPALHGLMMTSGRYDGPAAEETLVSCPDNGWLTFRIERHRWAPQMWERDSDPGEELQHRLGPTTRGRTA